MVYYNILITAVAVFVYCLVDRILPYVRYFEDGTLKISQIMISKYAPPSFLSFL